MTLEGTVVNGVIILDGGVRFPEGARVRVEVSDPDDVAPPPEPYDREKELEILREALEDVRAGRGVPARTALEELAEKLHLPLSSELPPEEKHLTRTSRKVIRSSWRMTSCHFGGLVCQNDSCRI